MKSQGQAFTDVYLEFTKAYSRVEESNDEQPRIPEKVIRCIWNDQLLKSSNLTTTDGEPLQVVFPGYWNFGSGPDFKSAAIKVDGNLLEGDVELHVYGIDWKAHKHSERSEYDNVILHVFMWKSRGKTSVASTRIPSKKKSSALPGAQIHELELKHFLKKGLLQLNDELDFDNYPLLNKFNYGLCHSPLARLPQKKLEKLLSAAGDARVYAKMDRFHDRVIGKGYEQTFYEGIAEALGYPHNKQTFQTLAENLTIAQIKELLPRRAGRDQKILFIQALMFGVAGLIDFNNLDLDSLSRGDKTYFENIQKIWEKHKGSFKDAVIDRTRWKFSGMRPANYPYRRIAGLAQMLIQHLDKGLFEDYLDRLKSNISLSGDKGYTTPTNKKLFDFFCAEGQGYWAEHYSPGGKKLKQIQLFIGKDRSREITVNIVIPIALIYARASKSKGLETYLGSMFETETRPTDNKWIRFMKHYILGNKESMVNLLNCDKRTQGLMQVYQDFCTQNENNCLRCKFPEVVEKYFS